MLDTDTKTRIDTARDILVGKVPDPKSQVEQITIALIYKFMDDMDKESVSLGGNATFFSGEYEKYSWTKIFDPRLGGFDIINLYSEAIEKLNHNPNIPQLFRDIFKNAYLPYRDPETLKLFLKTINEFHYDHSERLGDAFEYLLSVLGSQGDAGQFRTPRHIIDFIVSVLEPKKTDTILDPACGTAGFLISAYKYIIDHNTKKSKGDLLTPSDRNKLMTNFFGYDISPDMVRLSLVNMYLHGFTTPYIFEYDSLTSEERWGDTFDVILANPPFMTPKGGIKPHKKFTLQVNRSEVLFVDYICEHINPVSGRAGIIVPEGIIFQSSNAYKQLRKMLVDNNLLYAVVSLPAGVFNPYAGVKTSILLIDKALAKKSDKILFVKIENDGFDLGAQRNPVEGSNLPNAKDLILQFKESLLSKSEFISDNKNVFLIEKSKIASKDDYNLSIDRYRIDENVKQSNFEIKELGELCKFTQGVQIPQNEQIRISKDGYKRYLYISDFLNDDKIIYVKDCYQNKEVTKNNLIMVNTGNTSGKIFFGKPGILSNNLFKITFDNNIILTNYLYYVIKSEIFFKELSKYFKQGAQPHLGHKIIGEQKIPLPPISVQKEIVAKIENYQAIINGAKQVVENYKPQIDINPEWKMVELGDSNYFDILSGGTPDSKNIDYWNGNINWITLVDLPSKDFITEIHSSERKITKEGLKDSSAKLLPINTVVVSSRATIGRIGITKIELATNQGFKNIVIKDFNKTNVVFVALMVSTLVDKMKQLASGGTFAEISKTNFCTLQIPLPSLEEQQEIVSRIEKEKSIINSNKELIKIYEQKIKDEINKLWKQEY